MYETIAMMFVKPNTRNLNSSKGLRTRLIETRMILQLHWLPPKTQSSRRKAAREKQQVSKAVMKEQDTCLSRVMMIVKV
jgi:hypothetical protein